ncbi:MAG: aromatic acid exporter family protein [Tissierellaceae bacterium]|nr:aromatic acid exporter family protein [Tissierellaceae bacterium]
MRTIKTGLAVAISIILSELLNLRNPSLVGIAAIVSMQSSVNESFIAGKNRMLGTFVGAVVGLFFSYLLPYNYFFLGLGTIVVIYIHNLFKWKQSLSLSAIVFLVVFLYQDGDISRLLYAINRLIDTSIGVIVSMLINYFIAQPDNKQSLKYVEEHIYTVLKDLIYEMVTRTKNIDNNEFIERLEEFNISFDTVKNELHMDSKKSKSNKLALDVVTILDKIEVGLLTILELNIVPILNEENKILFEKLYSEEFKTTNEENFDKDIIYNYHINKVFNKLLKIEELF